MSGPSGTPAPTGCVYLGAPVFGKPPIWTQQSRCTITDRRVSARCVGAAAGMGVQAIRCGTFLYRGWNRTREIQKPLVFGGVLFHISFAVERNMAAGGIEKKVVGPLRPKVTRARGAEYSRRRERSERRRWRIQRGERVAAVKISSARRQAAQKFRAPQQCSFSNINRDAGPYGVRLSSCAGIRETADMDATVPLHDNRPAHRRAVRGSGSGDGGTSDSMRNLFVPWLESDKGNPKTVGFWRRSFPYFFRC